MSEVSFFYEGYETIIQCKKEDKLKDICQKFASKVNVNVDDIFFLHGGQFLNEDTNLNTQLNTIDKEENKISIIVKNKQENIPDGTNDFIISKDIICPKCSETCRINIDDYKVCLYGCQKGHNTENILLTDYYDTQKIYESKIICDICSINNKNSTYGHKFYRCCVCKKNLCPTCRSKHETHDTIKDKILDYDEISYKCGSHCENYISYCDKCRQNLCMLCETEHNKEHDITYYKNIMANIDNIKTDVINLKSKIDKIKNSIDEIIKMFNEVKKNIDIFYEINYNLLKNFDSQSRNYQILQNINQIKNYEIINDINQIYDNKSIENKMLYILNIYNKI